MRQKQSDVKTFRVVSTHPGNTKSTDWVRGPDRASVIRRIEDEYGPGCVLSCVERRAPMGVPVLEVETKWP